MSLSGAHILCIEYDCYSESTHVDKIVVAPPLMTKKPSVDMEITKVIINKTFA